MRRSYPRFTPPIDGGTILITGASAGIGRELARQLAPRAGSLVLVARRAERLEELSSELRARNPRLTVHVFPSDLADRGAREALLDVLDREVGAVDILINNAGLGSQALYDREVWPRLEPIIEVNVVALAHLTHRLVRGMVERGRGGILNIGSGAGFALMPGMAVYVGTKHFVHGFTETLRVELMDTGVVVTHVAPGPVETEFNEAAGMGGGARAIPPGMRISAEQCVREAIAGFDKGRAAVFPGGVYKVVMGMQRLTPRLLERAAMGLLARQMRREMGSGSTAAPAREGAGRPGDGSKEKTAAARESDGATAAASGGAATSRGSDRSGASS